MSSDLDKLQDRILELEAHLVATQTQLQQANKIISWVKTSRFWKLRSRWLSFKKLLLSLPEVDLLEEYYKTHDRESDLSNIDIPSSHSKDYQLWLSKNYRSRLQLEPLKDKALNLAFRPSFSILVPVSSSFNQANLLQRSIASVTDQMYPQWELCIVSSQSCDTEIHEVLDSLSKENSNLKIESTDHSEANIPQLLNLSLKIASGDFIILLNPQDFLSKDALFEVANILNRSEFAAFIYSDEDQVNEEGYHSYPFFKPDWCPDSFLSRMYTSNLAVYRRSLASALNGFNEGFEESYHYDFVLRLTELIEPNQILHIPKVLYHRFSPKEYRDTPWLYYTEESSKVVKKALERRGEPGSVIPTPNNYSLVRYNLKSRDRISIIIPTRNLGDILDTCLESIFSKSTYENYEVIVIDNGSTEDATFMVLEKWKKQETSRFRYYCYDIPFNYSKINNYAVTLTDAPQLLFLNNDTEVITPDWLEAMLEQSQRESIGAVGAMLLYSDGTIQHAGVIQIGNAAGHSHRFFPSTFEGYFGQLDTVNNYSAVTAACLMCKSKLFHQIGGFDTNLTVAFNDVDFCLRITDIEYNNIFLPHVKLYHHESKTRGLEDTHEKIQRAKSEVLLLNKKHKSFIVNDSCYSSNLSRVSEDFSIKI